MPIRLKAERQSRKLSQDELAEQAGLARSMISMLESGERIGSVANWNRLEAALGIYQRELRKPEPDDGYR